MVHHHLVDHHLREDRRGEARKLDRERGEQHLAPDALVAQQLGHEPLEAEGLGIRSRGVGIVGGCGVAPQEQHHWIEGFVKFCKEQGLRLAARGLEQHQLRAVAARQDRRDQASRVSFALAPERNTRERRRLEIERRRFAAAGMKTERAQRGEELFLRIRGRELAEEQLGIKRHAVQCAELAQYPDEIAAGQGLLDGLFCRRLGCHASPSRG